MITRLLEREGFIPLEAASAIEAIELFRSHSPVAVVSDIMMPGMDGLELLARIKTIDRGAAVILMTGLDTPEVVLQALRGGAANFFKKPFDLSDLLKQIRNVAEFRREAARAALFTPFLEREEKVFLIPASVERFAGVISQIAMQLPALLPPGEVLSVMVGIEEMIQNALEHGSLGIGCEGKAAALAAGCFASLVAERRAGPGGRRTVQVRTELTRQRLTVVIRDEGDGFDWRSLPSVDAHNILSFNGRGIFLTKLSFDEVRYNDRGNEVTLVKERMLPRDTAAESS
jgi:CheY-like chemotaxis protein